jgi:ribonuclease D
MKINILKVRISEEYLHKDQKMIDDFLASHEICKTSSAFVKDENYWSVFIYYEDLKSNQKYSVTKNSKADLNYLNDEKHDKYSAENEVLNSDELKISDSLKLWRSEKSKEQNLPAYFFVTNKEIFSIAKFKPLKKEELMEIKGFGKYKVEHYGEEIIEILEQI